MDDLPGTKTSFIQDNRVLLKPTQVWKIGDITKFLPEIGVAFPAGLPANSCAKTKMGNARTKRVVFAAQSAFLLGLLCLCQHAVSTRALEVPQVTLKAPNDPEGPKLDALRFQTPSGHPSVTTGKLCLMRFVS